MQAERYGRWLVGAACVVWLSPVSGQQLLERVAARVNGYAITLTDVRAAVALGVALWGLHLGMTQGLLATMVADTAPAHLRGTAFGFFNLASGIAMLVASVLAGLLWDRLGSGVTFYAGAVFSLAALLMLALRSRRSTAV